MLHKMKYIYLNFRVSYVRKNGDHKHLRVSSLDDNKLLFSYYIKEDLNIRGKKFEHFA